MKPVLRPLLISALTLPLLGRLRGRPRLRHALRARARPLQGRRQLEAGQPAGRRRPRQMVGDLPRSRAQRARGQGQHLQPERAPGRGQFPRGRRRGEGRALQPLSHDHDQPVHHRIADPEPQSFLARQWQHRRHRDEHRGGGGGRQRRGHRRRRTKRQRRSTRRRLRSPPAAHISGRRLGRGAARRGKQHGHGPGRVRRPGKRPAFLPGHAGAGLLQPARHRCRGEAARRHREVLPDERAADPEPLLQRHRLAGRRRAGADAARPDPGRAHRPRACTARNIEDAIATLIGEPASVFNLPVPAAHRRAAARPGRRALARCWSAGPTSPPPSAAWPRPTPRSACRSRATIRRSRSTPPPA